MAEWLNPAIFINLNERPDRLQHVLQEFDKIKVLGQRLAAKKLENGALGCSLSHIACIELAKKEKWDHVFVCEDDVEFLDPAVFHDSLQKLRDSGIPWDVLIIAGNNKEPFTRLTDFCISVHNCQTTTAYIVKSHYYDKLIQNFRESSAQLARNPEKKHMYALDVYWKKLQIEDNWLLLIPPSVSQYDNYSDIERREVSYHRMLLDYEKPWLTGPPPTPEIDLKTASPSPAVSVPASPANSGKMPMFAAKSGREFSLGIQEVAAASPAPASEPPVALPERGPKEPLKFNYSAVSVGGGSGSRSVLGMGSVSMQAGGSRQVGSVFKQMLS